MKTSQKTARRHAFKLMTAIAVSAFGIIAVNAAYAQSTSSSILGKSPTDASVTVHSDKGITRHGSPNSKGRYNLSALPPGTYEVSLERDGKTLATVGGIPLLAGRASQVDFTCENDQCTGVFNH